MAKANNSTSGQGERVARENNPFAHIPFSAGDLSSELPPGGGAKILGGVVTPEHRSALVASLNNAQELLATQFSRHPQLPSVVAVKLHEKGIAKSHRPLLLARSAGAVLTGHGGLDEMLLGVNPQTLSALRNLISTKTSNQFLANISVITAFEAWSTSKKLRAKSDAPTVQQLTQQLRTDGKLLFRLFKYNDDALTEQAEKDFVRLLDDLGLESRAIRQRNGPALYLLRLAKQVSPASLERVAAHPAVRAITAEQNATVAPSMSPLGEATVNLPQSPPPPGYQQ